MKHNTLVKAGVTDIEGKFHFDIKAGSYTLLANYFGKKVYEGPLELAISTDLGVLPVNTGLKLGAVVVKSRKKLVERKADRLVFNIENTIAATGGDALEALQIAPQVTITNDQISMMGKSKLSVMIDDRLVKLHGSDLVDFKMYNDARYFQLSISYTFGNSGLNLHKRAGGNEEERRRID